MTTRMTPERLTRVRELATHGHSCLAPALRETLDELDAVTRERDAWKVTDETLERIAATVFDARIGKTSDALPWSRMTGSGREHWINLARRVAALV
jgi:hypothetical protein